MLDGSRMGQGKRNQELERSIRQIYKGTNILEGQRRTALQFRSRKYT
jgi:hypothetical protein